MQIGGRPFQDVLKDYGPMSSKSSMRLILKTGITIDDSNNESHVLTSPPDLIKQALTFLDSGLTEDVRECLRTLEKFTKA